jgi:hypothetical protein
MTERTSRITNNSQNIPAELIIKIKKSTTISFIHHWNHSNTEQGVTTRALSYTPEYRTNPGLPTVIWPTEQRNCPVLRLHHSSQFRLMQHTSGGLVSSCQCDRAEEATYLTLVTLLGNQFRSTCEITSSEKTVHMV